MQRASLVKRTVKSKSGESKNYYVKIVSGDGSTRRHSLKTTNEGEAKDRLSEIQANLQSGRPWDFKPIVAVEEFTASLPANLALHGKRPATIKNTLSAWHRFCEWRKPAELGDVTEHDVVQFMEYLTRMGLANRTIAGIMNICSGVYTFAKSDLKRYDGPNPFRGVKRPRWQQTQPRFLSEPEVAEVIEIARVHSEDMHLFFGLGIFAGLRHKEILAARWEWITWDRQGSILVQDGPHFQTKSGKQRRVPISDELRPILDSYKQDAGYLVRPAKPATPKLRYRVNVSVAFGSVCFAAGVKDCRVHTLRHTFGSRLAQAGRSEVKIARWMGHADTRTTQVYMQLSEADDSDINVIKREG